MTAPRLTLLDATLELLDAAVEDPIRLARLLGGTVAEGWVGFPESLPGLRSSYARGHGVSAWGTLLFVLERPRTLVGIGGFKGGPSREGVVEIGYAIAPAFREQGLATEAVAEMVRRAFADSRVTAVDAHTLAQASASSRVLEKRGFQQIGELIDPEDGPIWHWRLRRPAVRLA